MNETITTATPWWECNKCRQPCKTYESHSRIALVGTTRFSQCCQASVTRRELKGEPSPLDPEARP